MSWEHILYLFPPGFLCNTMTFSRSYRCNRKNQCFLDGGMRCTYRNWNCKENGTTKKASYFALWFGKEKGNLNKCYGECRRHDPCNKTPKYLRVLYNCIPQYFLAEGGQGCDQACKEKDSTCSNKAVSNCRN